MARLSYLELPVQATGPVKDFYSAAFGLAFTDYGPDYASTTTGQVDLGLNGTGEMSIDLLLPLFQVEDLEEALEKVVANGGTIVVPIFAFPGGRRFHFKDPAGNLLGVFVDEPQG